MLTGFNANGDPCDVFGNIFMEPYFASPFEQNFNLLETSPCIDAGDPLLPLDPDDTVADMGAIYFHQGVGIEPEIELSDMDYTMVSVHPNPFNPMTTIVFSMPNASQVKLEVYDLQGRSVATLIDGWREAGSHDTIFAAAELGSGIYLFRLQAGETVSTGKMVLMK
ncbi:T9SS type A sorting domain-containing protein [bacterium]|nr:T9SS type A sorting domain-containing protein [bacterium]